MQHEMIRFATAVGVSSLIVAIMIGWSALMCWLSGPGAE